MISVMFAVKRSLFLRRLLVLMLICSAGPVVDLWAQGQAEYDAGKFGQSLEKETKKKSKQRREIPQPIISESQEDTIRIETLLTVTDVYVQDEKGSAVNGLKREDFRVSEDGVPQEIAVFSSGDETSAFPRSIVMVIDHSSSQLAYLENSIEAAKVLVSRLPANDRMAIVTDDVQLLQGFTTDRQLLANKLDSLKKKTLEGEFGKSMQFSALYAVINELFRGDELRPVVIFQTDGDQYSGLKGSGSGSEKTIFTFQELTKQAVSAGITVYAINPGTSFVGIDGDEASKRAQTDLDLGAAAYAEARHIKIQKQRRSYSSQFLAAWAHARAQDESAINRLAESTGGWAVNLTSPDKAGEAYDKIFDEMNRRYTIGYYPINQNRDGNLRLIEIKVGIDRYSVRCKSAYRAMAETGP